jgi:5-methylcytosine-specific restriction endonuclease McrA
MKLELFIIVITLFFIYDTYYDGKYRKLLLSWKKYYQMIFFALLGVGIYLLLKRSPQQGKNMLLYANNVVKYMPIDKSSLEFFSPIFDLTSSSSSQHGGFMETFNNIENNHQEKRILTSGKGTTKRSVSETKKKYVASQQDWKCDNCNSQLNAWFEVDHKIRLEYGGGNDVNNLVALCRECHGKKTALENMGI